MEDHADTYYSWVMRGPDDDFEEEFTPEDLDDLLEEEHLKLLMEGPDEYEGLLEGELAQQYAEEENIKEPRRLNRDLSDPLTYYHKHYEGLTRGQLSKKDPSLYFALKKRALLDAIPFKKAMRSVEELLIYYHEHYEGLTRGQLYKRDVAFYTRLLRARLIHHIPTKFPQKTAE